MKAMLGELKSTTGAAYVKEHIGIDVAAAPEHGGGDYWEKIIPPKQIISKNTPRVVEVKVDNDPFGGIEMGMREALIIELFKDPGAYILSSIRRGRLSILELSAMRGLVATVKDSLVKVDEAIEAYVPEDTEAEAFEFDFEDVGVA